MDVILTTPMSTPTKCGCASGIVVSCGSAKNKPGVKAKRKILPASAICPLCAKARPGSGKCCITETMGGDRADIGGDISEMNDDDVSSGVVQVRKSYTSLFKGALGRWSGKMKNKRTTRHMDMRVQSLPSENVYQIPNACTNNNCVSNQYKLDNETPAVPSSIINPQEIGEGKQDANSIHIESQVTAKQKQVEIDHKRKDECALIDVRAHLVAGRERYKIELAKKPTGTSWVVRRTRRGRHASNKENASVGEMPRQKLPNLPYRDDGKEEKRTVTKGLENGKRRRGKRKYFSSPIHRKEPTRENGEVQSTYVSFQDEFARDVFLKVEASDISAPSTTPESPAISDRSRPRGPIPSSSPRTYRPWWASSDTSPLQISPTTPSDDVFAETEYDTGKSICISTRGDSQNLRESPYRENEQRPFLNKEEEENARIAKLFREVNIAFGRNSPKQEYRDLRKNPPQFQVKADKRNLPNCEHTAFHGHMDLSNGATKCRVPSCRNVVQPEPIETIMASANLHASLDNAMSMLNESTKLLHPNDYHGQQQATHGYRHQSCSAVSTNQGLAPHQPIRPRTYSTCSRLETIAEENDRSEDTTINLDYNNGEDATSCTFSDSSEYEKLYPYNTRTDSSSMFSSATTFNRDSDSATSSLQRHPWGRRPINDSKTRWFLRGSSNSTARHNSTSTISVRSLRRDNNLPCNEIQNHINGPTTADKCAACEWARLSQFNFPSVPVIPNAAWSKIVNGGGVCHDRSHIHPWGVCSDQHEMPVLCHSHYLQYYQYLQNNPKCGRRRRQALHSASSQADSLIDYDINEVLSSLDGLVPSEHSILSSANSSVTNLHRSSIQHALNDQLLVNGGQVIMTSQANVRQYVNIRQHRKQATHKQSDTDVSINSDSAFSTNGSLTPSTRDGVNTDRDSVDSMADNTAEHNLSPKNERKFCNKAARLADSSNRSRYQEFQNSKTDRRAENDSCHMPGSFSAAKRKEGASRGKRTQSFEEPRAHKGLLAIMDISKNHEKRYSVISSVGSSSSPLTSDPLCDSAVHLQDTSSSHSTQLSSDSFYSSRTSFGDRDNCLLDRGLSLDGISRSSSEASLKSEGTLCLSDYALSQQNISLYSVPSFPQITDICSPVRLSRGRAHSTEVLDASEQNLNPNSSQFEDWISKAEITESVLESFMNSNLAYLKENSTELDIAVSSDNSRTPEKEKRDPSPTKNIGIYDSLTSSSGSSDSNTLGSGSSGSTYTTSSLRSYKSNSRFNTFDSSSCVSTDDTGETVIDQYMIRPNGRLHDIEEEVRRKKNVDSKVRYQPSAFHYENLEMPVPDIMQEDLQNKEKTTLSFGNLENVGVVVTEGVERNTHLTISQARRSTSLSCIVTSVTKVSHVVRHTKSLPDVLVSQYEEESITRFDKFEVSAHHEQVSSNSGYGQQNEISKYETPLSPVCSRILQTKVDSMIQNCNNIDNVISSLRKSLKSPDTSENTLDQKLLELGDILRQKDEIINRLQKMLLAYSFSRGSEGMKYPASATM